MRGRLRNGHLANVLAAAGLLLGGGVSLPAQHPITLQLEKLAGPSGWEPVQLSGGMLDPQGRIVMDGMDDAASYRLQAEPASASASGGTAYNPITLQLEKSTDLSAWETVQLASGMLDAQGRIVMEVVDREFYRMRVEPSGWTDLTSFLDTDSRIVYVSSSGSDSAAAAVHGRGYYLPGDTEIGADPTQPAGLVVAYATFTAAKAAIRTNQRIDGNPGTPQYPEWMLFHRGDSIDLGGNPLNRIEEGGRSEAKRRVYAAYGDPSQPRPRLTGGGGILSAWGSRGGRNLVFASLDNVNILEVLYGATNILFEDIAFRQTGTNAIQLGEVDNVTLRRCVFSGNFSAGSHVQGLFLFQVRSVVFEECVFDMNGYKEDPFNPSTWTGSLVSTGSPGALPQGTGIQPNRTYFDRNLYLSSYRDLKVRGNIISRNGGGGSAQLRVGGVAERNLFMFNESALVVGHTQADRSLLHNALVCSNLVLHDDPLLPPGGFGQGLGMGVGDTSQGILEDNIVAHFLRPNNGNGMLYATGIPVYTPASSYPAHRAMHVTIRNNTAIAANYGQVIVLPSTTAPDGIQAASVGGNVVAVMINGLVTQSAEATRPATVAFGDASVGPNLYYSAASSGFQRGGSSGTFAAWQAAGYDPASTLYPSLTELATAAGWRTAEQLNDAQGRHGWERDIVSYMQLVDPDFVPDEDITVDHGAPVDRRRPTAPMLRTVLSDPAAYPTGQFWSDRVLSDSTARLAARRTHAFLVFIERAKANRKGAWNSAYTAEAVNNYIREGLGKSRVEGPYTAVLPQ